MFKIIWCPSLYTTRKSCRIAPIVDDMTLTDLKLRYLWKKKWICTVTNTEWNSRKGANRWFCCRLTNAGKFHRCFTELLERDVDPSNYCLVVTPGWAINFKIAKLASSLTSGKPPSFSYCTSWMYTTVSNIIKSYRPVFCTASKEVSCNCYYCEYYCVLLLGWQVKLCDPLAITGHIWAL